jgi:hypothetical protein
MPTGKTIAGSALLQTNMTFWSDANATDTQQSVGIWPGRVVWLIRVTRLVRKRDISPDERQIRLRQLCEKDRESSALPQAQRSSGSRTTYLGVTNCSAFYGCAPACIRRLQAAVSANDAWHFARTYVTLHVPRLVDRHAAECYTNFDDAMRYKHYDVSLTRRTML